MTILRKLFSGDNSEYDIKAILATCSFVVALGAYAYYAFWLQKDLPPNLTSITQVFIGAALLGSAATVLNQKLRVTPPIVANPATTTTTTTTAGGPVG